MFFSLLIPTVLAGGNATVPADVDKMPQMTHALEKKMAQAATDEWTCAADQITFAKAGALMVKVAGCGKEVVFGHVKDSPSWYPDFDVRKKAPFELSCDAANLTYTLIDERNRGVEGCGKKAMYVIGPNGWLMNSSSGG